MRLSDVGEFGLIQRLLTSNEPGSRELVVRPGDDAAVWRVGDEYVIATTDTMVDGVHFRSDGASWRDLGWKALAVNVSDIAAMGGRPTQALVTLCLPPEIEVRRIDELQEGLTECAKEYGIAIAGGDVVRSPITVVTVALLGSAAKDGDQPALLLRSGAKVGDVIAVTGTLGDSAGGLRRLTEGVSVDDVLVQRHARPTPRIAEGQAAVAAGIRCGIDVSDGLLQDLGHVCDMSGMGALIRVSDVPLSDELRAAYADEAMEMACTGGEDYELLVVGPRDKFDSLPITVIGEIVDGGGVKIVDSEGTEITFERTGWDAFRS